MGGNCQPIDPSDMKRDGSIGGRNINSVILSFIFLCCSPALLLQAQQTDAAASGAIRALEHEWVEAQSHNDDRDLSLILDSEVVYVEYGRLVTKADYLLRIKHQDPSANEVVMEPMIVRALGTRPSLRAAIGKRNAKAVCANSNAGASSTPGPTKNIVGC